MTNDELIARAEAALEGVTDGPWELRLFQSGTVQVMIRDWADGSPDKQHGGNTYGYHSAYMSMHNIGTRDVAETDNEKYRNGKFIAEARDLVPALIAALKASEARGKDCLETAINYREEIDQLRTSAIKDKARVKELEEAVIDTGVSLVAAISLLEKGGKDAAWSDKVFHTMLNDYKKSVGRSREVLKGGAE